MANDKIEELTKDLNEYKTFLEQATRTTIKNTISVEIRKIESKISLLREEEKASAATPTSSIPRSESTGVKLYEVELTNYGWDQSDKFIKIFVTLDGVQGFAENDVSVAYTSNSIQLLAKGTNKEYKLIIKNLLENIDVEKSYRKIKTNMIAIYAKKVKEGSKWSHLTVIAKRSEESKKILPDKEDTSASSDPQSGLFNIMKNMYQTGDPEMKKMISKIWVEGEEKRARGEAPGMPSFNNDD